MNPQGVQCLVKIINLTQHPIVLYTQDTKYVIPPSGQVLRINTEKIQTNHINGIPVNIVKPDLEVSLIPPSKEGVIYIASTFAAMTLKRPDILSPDVGNTAIRDDRGKVIGITQLQKFEE